MSFNKIFWFQPPHNYVVFSFTGIQVIDVPIYLSGVENNLPNNRLSIQEYAERLKESITLNNEHLFVQGKVTNIAVCGYDQNNQSKIYTMSTLENLTLQEIIRPRVLGGNYNYETQINTLFGQRLKQTLLSKQKSLAIIGGKLTSFELSMINSLNSRPAFLSQHLMTLNDAIDYLNFLIVETSREEVKRNHSPMVGDIVDLVKITAADGVSVLKHEGDGSNLVVANTNKHYFDISCCGPETRLQINFGKDFPLNKGWKGYPPNNIFQCSRCHRRYDISELRKEIADKANCNFT